jgi:hypothetical protein
VNIIQKILTACMGPVILGVILFPQWTVRWTIRVDCRYYYEADAHKWTATHDALPPPDLIQSGSETESHEDTVRACLFSGPRRPLCSIPAPKTESTGTGSVDLGRRRTVYTGAKVVEFSAHLNIVRLVAEAAVMTVSLAIFLLVFRGDTKNLRTPLIPPNYLAARSLRLAKRPDSRGTNFEHSP